MCVGVTCCGDVLCCAKTKPAQHVLTNDDDLQGGLDLRLASGRAKTIGNVHDPDDAQAASFATALAARRAKSSASDKHAKVKHTSKC